MNIPKDSKLTLVKIFQFMVNLDSKNFLTTQNDK